MPALQDQTAQYNQIVYRNIDFFRNFHALLTNLLYICFSMISLRLSCQVKYGESGPIPVSGGLRSRSSVNIMSCVCGFPVTEMVLFCGIPPGLSAFAPMRAALPPRFLYMLITQITFQRKESGRMLKTAPCGRRRHGNRRRIFPGPPA